MVTLGTCCGLNETEGVCVCGWGVIGGEGVWVGGVLYEGPGVGERGVIGGEWAWVIGVL